MRLTLQPANQSIFRLNQSIFRLNRRNVCRNDRVFAPQRGMYIYLYRVAPVFDVDIQASDIIVRSHRKICYENGMVYKGFVDVTTGLADCECFVLPRDAGSALRILLFKPAMTDAATVWSQQRCFAENRIFVLDAEDHVFLSAIQARVATIATTQDIRIVKGMPSGHDSAIQRRVESTLAEAFSNPNSLLGAP